MLLIVFYSSEMALLASELKLPLVSELTQQESSPGADFYLSKPNLRLRLHKLDASLGTLECDFLGGSLERKRKYIRTFK